MYSCAHVHRSTGVSWPELGLTGLHSKRKFGSRSIPLTLHRPEGHLACTVFTALTWVVEGKANYASIFQASACITPADIPLAKASLMTKLKFKQSRVTSPGGHGKGCIILIEMKNRDQQFNLHTQTLDKQRRKNRPEPWKMVPRSWRSRAARS